MTQPGDSFALYLIIGIIFYFLIRKWLPLTFTEWLKRSRKQQEPTEITGKVPSLLEKNGYELTEAKQKIPMTISADDRNYDSRLYIDYIAKKEDEWFLVFVERARKPIKQYGPALRDAFLSYYLLYRPDGVLYVKKDQQIQIIDFEIGDFQFQRKTTRHVWKYVLFFALGILFALFSR